MSESGDYDPGPWRGHDFADARKTYDDHAGRSYADAIVTGKKAEDLIPESISTKSSSPLVIICDVTGSMGEWPATIFSKLPYLELEGQEYLGKDMEISFGAFGDAYWDKYPLQGRAFVKGTALKEELEAIAVEGGGGSGIQETSELTALYYARNCSMPNAIRKPIYIFITDEKPYDTVDKKMAKLAHVDLRGNRIGLMDIFRELKSKFAVYLIQKPYARVSGNDMDSTTATVHKKWVEVLGEDHIAMLSDPGRVVDVIFGIFAKETNRVEYFNDEIEGRQKSDQVKSVYKSLKTIHALPPSDSDRKKETTGKSVLRISESDDLKGMLGSSKKTKPLI